MAAAAKEKSPDLDSSDDEAALTGGSGSGNTTSSTNLEDVDSEDEGMTDDVSVPDIIKAKKNCIQREVIFRSFHVSVGQGWETEGGVYRPRTRHARTIAKGIGLLLGVGAVLITQGALLIPAGVAATAYFAVRASRRKAKNKLTGQEMWKEVEGSKEIARVHVRAGETRFVAVKLPDPVVVRLALSGDTTGAIVTFTLDGSLPVVYELRFSGTHVLLSKDEKPCAKAKLELIDDHNNFWFYCIDSEFCFGMGLVTGQCTMMSWKDPSIKPFTTIGFMHEGKDSVIWTVFYTNENVADIARNREEERHAAAGVQLIQSLMSSKRGGMKLLRGDRYVCHGEYEMSAVGSTFLVLVTVMHVVVLRKKKGLVGTRVTLVGVLGLNKVAFVEEYRLNADSVVLNLGAVDRSSIDVPVAATPEGDEVRNGLIWALNHIEDERKELAQKIRLMVFYSRAQLHIATETIRFHRTDPKETTIEPVDGVFHMVLYLVCDKLPSPGKRVLQATMCVVSKVEGGKLTEIDRTETAFESFSPAYGHAIALNWPETENPTLQFDVHFVNTTQDHMSNNTKKLGSARCTVSDIIKAERMELTAFLSDTEATITIVGKPVRSLVPKGKWPPIAKALQAWGNGKSPGPRHTVSVLQSLGSDDISWTLHFLRSMGHIKIHKAERANLFDLLGVKMVSRLSCSAKLALVEAVLPEFDEEAQQFVANVFKSAQGRDLYELKDGFDIGESGMSFSSLIFHKVSVDHIRDELIKHIKEQGERLRNNGSFKRPLRILSDIDDTLVHSGYGLGGPKFPKGTVLPGYVALIEALDARVAFVTARPEFLQHRTYRVLRLHYGIKKAIVLSGHLRDSLLVPFAPRLANQMVAKRKFNNISQYTMLFPECQFVWFGDSGQGDILVGESLRETDPTGDMHIATFIQDVVQSDGISFKFGSKERQEALPAYVCDNYLEVAIRMYERELLDGHGLRKVAIMSSKQIRQLLPKFSSFDVAKARAMELERQLEICHKLLEVEKLVPVVGEEDVESTI